MAGSLVVSQGLDRAAAAQQIQDLLDAFIHRRGLGVDHQIGIRGYIVRFLSTLRNYRLQPHLQFRRLPYKRRVLWRESFSSFVKRLFYAARNLTSKQREVMRERKGSMQGAISTIQIILEVTACFHEKPLVVQRWLYPGGLRTRQLQAHYVTTVEIHRNTVQIRRYP